jgi:hypothetical protein
MNFCLKKKIETERERERLYFCVIFKINSKIINYINLPFTKYKEREREIIGREKVFNKGQLFKFFFLVSI